MAESSSYVDNDALSLITRQLQQEGSRSRAVLTVLYLCVLGLCFVVPVFYYFRMHCEERNARRMRELEMAGITEALEQSEQNREESRAARRKYREERRARILQLFAPVRMILKEENFPHLMEQQTKAADKETKRVEEVIVEKAGEGGSDIEEGKKHDTKSDDLKDPNDAADGTSEVIRSSTEDPPSESRVEEEATLVRVPAPGMYITPTTMDDPTIKMRTVENMCTICLCSYEVGSDIVWSSNSLCEHVFHESCIEQWLMKQREGPLCPCCRRDFIIDPYDLEEEPEEILAGSLTGYQGDAEGESNATSPISVAAFEEDEIAAALRAESPNMEGSTTDISEGV